jgi:hypothetical protein
MLEICTETIAGHVNFKPSLAHSRKGDVHRFYQKLLIQNFIKILSAVVKLADAHIDRRTGESKEEAILINAAKYLIRDYFR